MLTVHHLQRSQSERIVWLCEELDIPYELKLYARNPLIAPPELAALTPLGAAPVITDSLTKVAATKDKHDKDRVSKSNHVVLSESGAIAELIIHRYGSGRLALPPTHPDYANYLFFFHFANGTLQPALMRALSFVHVGLSEDHPARVIANERVGRALMCLDDQLKSNAWLAGQELTAADIMTCFSLSTFRIFNSMDLSSYEGILNWLHRIGQRKAFQLAMEKGDPGFEPVLTATAPQLFGASKGYMSRKL